MGYTTKFNGSLKFNKPVSKELKTFINKFSETRRMKRDVEKIKENYPDWKKKCFGGNLGIDGEYFIGGCNYSDDNIIEFNNPPGTQPGLWCQWIINENDELVWDENEKFYNYVEWLEYLISNFFAPFGYVLNGAIRFEGEEISDAGVIAVLNNKCTVEYDSVTNHSIGK